MSNKYYQIIGGSSTFDSQVGSYTVSISTFYVYCNSSDRVMSIYYMNGATPVNIPGNYTETQIRFTPVFGFLSVLTTTYNNYSAIASVSGNLQISMNNIIEMNFSEFAIYGLRTNFPPSQPNPSTPTDFSEFTVESITTPSCFDESVKILYLNKHLMDEYISVQMLKVGDLVKTYKHGYRRITDIGKNVFFNNPDNFEECMYMMKDSGLIITGYHGILVDEPDVEELEKQSVYNITEKIDDKYVVISSVSKLFEKDTSNKPYTFYNFALESDDENAKYGIYANGVLCETISQELFRRKSFII